MNVTFAEYGRDKRDFYSCFIKSNECRQFVKYDKQKTGSRHKGRQAKSMALSSEPFVFAIFPDTFHSLYLVLDIAKG